MIAAVRNEDEAKRAEEIVASQTYPNLELVAPELGRDFDALWDDGSIGSPSFHVGTFLARGDYFGYLLPQDRWSAAHVEKLVELLEQTKANFAYSRLKDGDQILGTDPPRSGEVFASCIVHRANLTLGENWRDGGPDYTWDLVTRWVGMGYRDQGTGQIVSPRWAFLNAITVEREAVPVAS